MSEDFAYDRNFFDPKEDLRVFDEEKIEGKSVADRRDGRIYLYNQTIILAINVAMATGRPLLVRGYPGCGKSSLAYNVARVSKRKYYEEVITSRTQARDLLYTIDVVKRLSDSQSMGKDFSDGYYKYIKPGKLWWIFDNESAERRGFPQNKELDFNFKKANDPARNTEDSSKDKAPVLLIDEVDKADPDFANSLLVPFGAFEFDVDEIGETIRLPSEYKSDFEKVPLVIITTNGERSLPDAFLRRCVALDIKEPNKDDFIKIAVNNEGIEHKKDFYGVIYDVMKEAQKAYSESYRNKGLPLSVAEYLDAIRACKRLDIKNKGDVLDEIIKLTNWRPVANKY